MRFDVEKHIIFKVIETLPKTKVYEVWNIFDNCAIGTIGWDRSWRHYVFTPYDGTKFSDRCGFKIFGFVQQLNEEHKKKSEKEILHG